MFRSKKKLREQLQLLKERNIALSNALRTEKCQNRRKQTLIDNTRTAHQELKQQYDALHIKYMKVTAPKEMQKKNLRKERGKCQR